jgi:hypothetical protein
MEMPNLGSLPERSTQEMPSQAQAQMGEAETLNFLIEILMDNWRRTGQVGGMPISNEEEALQTAVKVAMAQLQQAAVGQMGGMAGGAPAMPSPTGDNPLLAALRGGVR